MISLLQLVCSSVIRITAGLPRRCALLLLVLVSCCPASAITAQGIVVVVGKEAPRLEIFAASELKTQLGRLSGSEVTIATTVPKASSLLVFLGSPATNPARKASPHPVVSTSRIPKAGTWPSARPLLK